MRDLTPEEEAQLQDMSGTKSAVTRYSWDENFQRKLLAMMLTDQFMLLQSQDLVLPEYFSNEAHVVISKILLNYFNERKSLPEKWIVANELSSQLKDRDISVKLHHMAELHSIYDYYVPGIETRDYLLEKITYFAKVQAVKVAFGRSLEKITANPEDEATWSFVHEQMRQAMMVNRSFEPGVDYFMNLDEMYRRSDEVFEGKNRFTSGFYPIDEGLAGNGLYPGEIASWIGLPGTGKCLLWSTKVLMADGSTKEASHLVSGDLVMGDDSTPRKVLLNYKLMDTKYEIKPSHGKSYFVNSQHILALKNQNGEKKEISVLDYEKTDEDFKKEFFGYRVIVDLNKDKSDFDFYKLAKKIFSKRKISEKYKKASLQDRLNLLAGIIDIAAFTNENSYVFYISEGNFSQELSDFIASLGFIVKSKKCCSRLKKIHYRILVKGDFSRIPIKLENKKINCDFDDALLTNLQVINTQQIDLFNCISVDGNKLFLLEDCTVVHNSLALCKSSVANVLLGHKVLYLTMEMSELGIMQRFTSQFAKVDIGNLRGLKDEVYKTIEEFKNSFDDPNLLHVKQFPGGVVDVNSIRGFMAQLELRKWKPNLLIVDYVGEMKHDPSVKKYEAAYNILRDLRSFGVEKNHCTFTCVQPNSSAAKLQIGDFIDESNIGTSFDQFKPLDAFWSINQQTIEKDAEVGRIFVIKHRNGKSKYPFKIGFNYKTLDMFAISYDRYKESLSLIQEKKASSINIDIVPQSRKNKRTGCESEPETYTA